MSEYGGVYMTMNTWYIGDKVRLKSGGPVMTVGSLQASDALHDVNCCWFDSGGNVKSYAFPSDSLEKAI
jgi:uncharacterized protein YodC (DUF2158 family)